MIKSKYILGLIIQIGIIFSSSVQADSEIITYISREDFTSKFSYLEFNKDEGHFWVSWSDVNSDLGLCPKDFEFVCIFEIKEEVFFAIPKSLLMVPVPGKSNWSFYGYEFNSEVLTLSDYKSQELLYLITSFPTKGKLKMELEDAKRYWGDRFKSSYLRKPKMVHYLFSNKRGIVSISFCDLVEEDFEKECSSYYLLSEEGVLGENFSIHNEERFLSRKDAEKLKSIDFLPFAQLSEMVNKNQ